MMQAGGYYRLAGPRSGSLAGFTTSISEVLELQWDTEVVLA